MKTKSIILSASIALGVLLGTKANAQNVGINGTGAAPDQSALLDLDASDKGLLIPRVALTATNSAAPITSPVTSLLVYNTATSGTAPNDVTPGFYFWNGTEWESFGNGGQTPSNPEQYIPTAQYPSFDATAPYLLDGALWVGYDATNEVWKYNKQATGRGLTDPGDPSTWVINSTTIDVWNGDLNSVPSGTHMNNKYYPPSMAALYNQDDIMVRVGDFWIDKYESSIIDVSSGSWLDNDDVTILTPADTDIRGNGQGISMTWMAFSQRRKPSSGMSWFVAQRVAVNSGKTLVSNAQWQAAASGSLRSDDTGLAVSGDPWTTIADQDISTYGVVGMASSVWEWVADWLMSGPDSGLSAGNQTLQGTGYGNDMVKNFTGSVATRNSSVSPSGSYVSGKPGALARGGASGNGTGCGIYAIDADDHPSFWTSHLGFRCVRQ